MEVRSLCRPSISVQIWTLFQATNWRLDPTSGSAKTDSRVGFALAASPRYVTGCYVLPPHVG